MYKNGLHFETNPDGIHMMTMNHSIIHRHAMLSGMNTICTVGQRRWRTAVSHLPTWRPSKQANKARPSLVFYNRHTDRYVTICLGFGGGGLQFPMHASIDLSRYISYVEEFFIGHKLSFCWPDINTHQLKQNYDFQITASTFSYNFDEVCEYSSQTQQLVFPVPDFKIPRML